jgi:hypothetical protein
LETLSTFVAYLDRRIRSSRLEARRVFNGTAGSDAGYLSLMSPFGLGRRRHRDHVALPDRLPGLRLSRPEKRIRNGWLTFIGNWHPTVKVATNDAITLGTGTTVTLGTSGCR